MFINDIWSYGVTTNTKKIVAEAQKDGYLLNFYSWIWMKTDFLTGRRSTPS